MSSPGTGPLLKHLEALVGERNHQTSPSALDAAGNYIADHFQSLGLSVSRDPVFFENSECFNIFATKPGEGKDSGTFIIAAHYDSVTGSPGADDNASAVAGLLELARCLCDVPLNQTLIFAGYTLEEYGFIGSDQHVRQIRDQSTHLTGMISLEMIGYRDEEPGSQHYPPYVPKDVYPDHGDFIAVVGNDNSKTLSADILQSFKQNVPGLGSEILVVPGDGTHFPEVGLSDHKPFWDLGLPAVMLTDTAFFRNPNYHKATDTLDTLDVEFMKNVCDGLVHFCKHHLVKAETTHD